MSGVLTWTVNQYLLLGITLAVFGFLGFRRGINRELLSMVGIGLGMVISGNAGPALQPQVNRFYRMFRFAVGGGLTSSDPAAAWTKASQLPGIVTTSAQIQLLSLLVFIFIALVFYFMGQRLFPTAKSVMVKFLGLLAGGINGFLTSYYLFPLFLNESRAVVVLPGEEVTTTLSTPDNIALVAVFFVVVLIAFGLYSAGSSKKK